MATIKFLLQTANNPANIYLRFTHGRGTNIKRKTGLFIDPKLWSAKSGYPIPRSVTGINLKRDLEALEQHVKDEHNSDYKRGALIDGDWLETIIGKFYNQAAPDSLEYFVNYGDKYVEELRYKTSKSGSAGATPGTISKYRVIVDKVRLFEKHHKTRVLVRDIDLNFRSAFIAFLSEEVGLHDNTIGRYIKFVKTIVMNAEVNGIDISKQIRAFKGFTAETPIVTLTENDIKKLSETEFDNERLDTARDWLIISCRTAQRSSDLLRMNSTMFAVKSGQQVIELRQKKTKKPVTLAIHPQVKRILAKRNGQFPSMFTRDESSNNAMYNRYLKTVCEKAGLNELTKGNLRNPETGKYEEGMYPKWMLITSHTGRRSFATNEYGGALSTQEIMSMTGHTSEKTFLKYVGKDWADFAEGISKKWSALEHVQ